MKHKHRYGWSVEPEGVAWFIAATCECGDRLWACTARTTADLNDTLHRAFARNDLDALGYFTAPTAVPDDLVAEAA